MGGDLPLEIGPYSYASVRLAALACCVRTEGAHKRRYREVLKNQREGLLVRAEPLELAEEITHRMVDVVRTMDGALFLEAEPTCAEAIKKVLLSKGVRVSELAGSSRYIAALPSWN
jgi:hypothetical protein